MENVITSLMVTSCFLGIPWIIFHYITKWKSMGTLTSEDEDLLEELHDVARRLDERICSIERIMTAENPNWRAIACDPVTTGIEDRTTRSNEPLRRISR
jgi:phage shock protein B